MRPPQLQRLSSKFLLIVLPAVLVAAALFMAATYALKVREREAANIALATRKAEGDAGLLSYPLWNLDGMTVDAILRSRTDDPRVRCVRLDETPGLEAPAPVGRCDHLDGLTAIVAPVRFVDAGGEHAVGRLQQWVDTSVASAEVWRDVVPQMLQLVVLVGALVLASLVAFRYTVRAPLAQVGASLRAFRETGERHPVPWDSADELGEFIREYNAGLQRQETAERNLQGQLNFQMALHHTMPTPFAYLDQQLVLFDANPAFHRQLGLGAEAMGRAMSTLIPGIDWPAITALQPGEVSRQELVGLEVEDEDRGFSLACSPFLDSSGAVSGYVLVLQDITSRLLQEHALRAAVRRTESALADLHRTQEHLIQSEKLASLGSLVAGVAHEINTPLGNSLTVSTHLAEHIEQVAGKAAAGSLRRSELTAFFDEAREGCGILLRSLASANEQIRRFKQVAVDQTASRRRLFDLREVIEDVASTLKPRIRNTGHRLLVEVPEGIEMDSYPGPLDQVITNCVQNAILHGFEGLSARTVRVRAGIAEPGWVRISVIDDGCGIASEHIKHVFDPFFTTKLGRGGSGLGMNLAYSLATGPLGGRIGVHSEQGQGTEVSLELPLQAPEESDA